MMRTAVLLLLLIGGAAFCDDRPTSDKLRPISAAEAEQRVAETRDFLADTLWVNTEAHWHVGGWNECIRLCRQIVELAPDFVEAYTGGAWMLWNLDRDEEAVELYRSGITANPDSYEIYHEFGMYYYYEKQWDKAAEQFRKSVECEAPMAFQHMLPNALERGGRKQEALREWRGILERFPDDAVAERHIKRLEQQPTDEQ